MNNRYMQPLVVTGLCFLAAWAGYQLASPDAAWSGATPGKAATTKSSGSSHDIHENDSFDVEAQRQLREDLLTRYSSSPHA